jgi:hypothetical protein
LGGTDEKGGDKQAELFPDSLLWAIVSVFVVGLGCTIGLMAVMKNVVGFNNNIILTVTLLSFFLMFVVEGVFIWQLLSRRNVGKEVFDVERLKNTATRELDAAQARTLPEPMPSVTENTTRAFEPIYNKVKSD